VKIQISILVFLMFCLSSCQRTGIDFVEGYVYASDTKEPIKNAHVKMYWTVGDHDWDDGAFTNEKGHYKIKYNHRDNVKYRITASSDEYWGVNSHQGIVNGNRSHVNFYMDPFANVQFRFINTSSYTHSLQSSWDPKLSSVIKFTLKPFQDTTIPTLVKANGNGSSVFFFWNNQAALNTTVTAFGRGTTVTHTVSFTY
jgi:hypothetical protein